jgi:hypothetical protein
MEWRTIPGFSQYEISEHGDIKRRVRARTFLAGRSIRPQLIKGYLEVELTSDGGRRCKRGVHRLVTMAFHGAPPSDIHEAAHWDGDAGNNHFRNLRWATPKENMADVVRHGRHRNKVNIQNLRSPTFPPGSVDAVRARFTGKHGEQISIARELGLSSDQVNRIVKALRSTEPKEVSAHSGDGRTIARGTK